MFRHGTEAGFVNGCQCAACQQAGRIPSTLSAADATESGSCLAAAPGSGRSPRSAASAAQSVRALDGAEVAPLARVASAPSSAGVDELVITGAAQASGETGEQVNPSPRDSRAPALDSLRVAA